MMEIEAKALEERSLWREAARVWEILGREADVTACNKIADSIDAGDRYRQDVDNTIGAEPELTPSTIKEYQEWHKNLAEIYRKHFG